MDIIFLLPVMLTGAVLFRMRGGWGPKLPRLIEQMLFCLIFLVPLLVLHPLLVVLGYAAAVAAVLKGHGRNMDLGHSKPNETVEAEWYEFTIVNFTKLSAYWYDVIGIAVSGLTYTILPGYLYAMHDPLSGLLIALSGALKAPAYIIGWALHPNYDDGPKLPLMKSATEVGEFLTGAFIWGAVFAACI